MQKAAANQAWGVHVCSYVYTYVHTNIYGYILSSTGRLLPNRTLCSNMNMFRGAL